MSLCILILFLAKTTFKLLGVLQCSHFRVYDTEGGVRGLCTKCELFICKLSL